MRLRSLCWVLWQAAAGIASGVCARERITSQVKYAVVLGWTVWPGASGLYTRGAPAPLAVAVMR